MASVNVLISDHNNACAFFLKSVLKPQGFGVSLAFSEEETMTKLATGLFDTVMCDSDADRLKTTRFLRGINDLLPGLPIVMIYGTETERAPDADLFCGMDKPLKPKKVMEVMRRVKNAVTCMENRRVHTRRDVSLPAELNVGGRTIFCRATNLSKGGMQVETLSTARVKRGLEALFRERKNGPILAKLFLGGRRVWNFKTNLAYVERFRFHQPEQVGLSFSDLPEKEKSELETFLVGAPS